jgi:hypothetical protein
MKINIALGLLIIFFSGCSSSRYYLPSSDKIDVNEYGSYIRIRQKTPPSVSGELIAIDSNKIVVLTEETKICTTVLVNDVEHFTLRYAKQKNYGWTVPLYMLATLTHGFFAIYTLPASVIVTVSVSILDDNSFKYTDKNMTYDKLGMFARFPQGIPPNIDLASIK